MLLSASAGHVACTLTRTAHANNKPIATTPSPRLLTLLRHPQGTESGLLVPEVVTAPYDPRFPNTNQARHCFIRYNEYYK
jgi:hypothetical protein